MLGVDAIAVRGKLLGTEAAVLAAGASLVSVAIAISLRSSEPSVERLFDNVHWTAAYATAAILAWLGLRKASGDNRKPRAWFAWALGAYALGQLLWDVQVAIDWNPFPGPSDAFYLCLGPGCGLGLLQLLWRSMPGQRRTALLDIAGLTAAVLALTLALYLPRRGDESALSLAVLVAYPVGLCWAACVGVITALTLHLTPRPGWILFLASLLGNGALWLTWNAMTLDHTLQDGTAFNALFSVVALGQGMGALHFHAEVSSSPAWERFCEGVLRTLPLLGVALSAFAVVLVYTLPGAPLSMRWSALAGSLVVVVLASIRQSVLLDERERLFATERTLRQQEEAYRMLVEQAVDGIFIADAQGRYLDVNSSGAAMLQMTRDEVIGLTIADIVAPDQVARIAAEVDELQRGLTVSRPWTLRRKDGSLFSAEISAKMLPDGRLQGMVRDVSKREELEAQLRQSQKLEAIGTLAAGIAHDFNNLLAAIRGHSGLAVREISERDRVLGRLAEIEHAAARATRLVQQIVDFSRPTPPSIAQVRLPELVAEVGGLLRGALPAGVEIDTLCAEDTPEVSGDASQLHQVLVNLCTNAWQAMEGKPGKITLRTSRELRAGAEHARITIRDDGKGMEPATLERVFEPFFTTKEVGQGSGLGLSVVHSIVRNHGGVISLDSAPSQGTTVTIDLPAATATPAEREPERAPEPAPAPAPRPRVRVLYVDDEQSIVSFMKGLLAVHGHEVTTFGRAADALAYVQADPQRFDVLVTDYNMPVMSGLELVARVRELRPDAPFVLTSGYIDDELQSAAAAAGVRHIAQKPVSIEELLSAIASVARDTASHRASSLRA